MLVWLEDAHLVNYLRVAHAELKRHEAQRGPARGLGRFEDDLAVVGHLHNLKVSSVLVVREDSNTYVVRVFETLSPIPL